MIWIILLVAILVAAIVLVVMDWVSKVKTKQNLLPFDRLKKSEKQLKEFQALSPEERLENYEELRKAISRLHSILSQVEGITYEKQEALNWDFLHSDVCIIPYLGKNAELEYASYNEAKRFSFPNGEQWEVINPATGEYQLDGHRYFSPRLAIDSSLQTIANRWLEEISEIETAISEAKRKSA